MSKQTYDKRQEEYLEEILITVDENDHAIGFNTKRECHLMANINNGLIHRGFSVLLFNTNNELLVTQRSDKKITFASCLTNSLCSHPLYNDMEREEKDAIGVKRAAQRRLNYELGINVEISDIVYITRFLYKAPYNEIWGEHEIDYLLIVRKDISLSPNPNEVSWCKWISKDQFKSTIASHGNRVGKWFQIIIDNYLYKIWNNISDVNICKSYQLINKF